MLNADLTRYRAQEHIWGQGQTWVISLPANCQLPTDTSLFTYLHPPAKVAWYIFTYIQYWKCVKALNVQESICFCWGNNWKAVILIAGLEKKSGGIYITFTSVLEVSEFKTLCSMPCVLWPNRVKYSLSRSVYAKIVVIYNTNVVKH